MPSHQDRLHSLDLFANGSSYILVAVAWYSHHTNEIACTMTHTYSGSISDIKFHLWPGSWKYLLHYSIQYDSARHISCESQACMVKVRKWGGVVCRDLTSTHGSTTHSSRHRRRYYCQVLKHPLCKNMVHSTSFQSVR